MFIGERSDAISMDDALWQQWNADWQRIVSAMRQHDVDAEEVVVEPPATIEELSELERKLGVFVPVEIAILMTTYSRRVRLGWHCGYSYLTGNEVLNRNFPPPFDPIFSSWADALWDLDNLEQLYKIYEGNKAVFPLSDVEGNSDDYNNVWHGKFPLMTVPNGDQILLDISQTPSPVIYASHDGSHLHGIRLGLSLMDFITRWSAIGCPGPECWEMEPFYDEEANLLIPNEDVAKAWWQLLDSGTALFPIENL